MNLKEVLEVDIIEEEKTDQIDPEVTRVRDTTLGRENRRKEKLEIHEVHERLISDLQ